MNFKQTPKQTFGQRLTISETTIKLKTFSHFGWWFWFEDLLECFIIFNNCLQMVNVHCSLNKTFKSSGKYESKSPVGKINKENYRLIEFYMCPISTVDAPWPMVYGNDNNNNWKSSLHSSTNDGLAHGSTVNMCSEWSNWEKRKSKIVQPNQIYAIRFKITTPVSTILTSHIVFLINDIISFDTNRLYFPKGHWDRFI